MTTKAAGTTVSVVSRGSLLAFAFLVLGVIARWLGRTGIVQPMFAERVMPSRL